MNEILNKYNEKLNAKGQYSSRGYGPHGPRYSGKPEFTQRHFWAIAEVLNNSNAPSNIVEAFAGMFAADNSRFKWDKFMEASGVDVAQEELEDIMSEHNVPRREPTEGEVL